MNTSEDPISKNNMCSTNVEDLKEVFLQQMQPGQIYTNSILWLTQVSDSLKFSSVRFVVKDNNNTFVNCYLYNMVTSDARMKQVQK